MKKLDFKLLEDIAIELGVEPSFIEKDWFAVKILKTIASILDINIIFTGGTSLSKGYGLIKRFSEDLDFRIGNSSDFNKTKRKTLRSDILQKLREVNEINFLEDSLQKHNSSKFFSINIEYPQSHKPINSLRPHLKLEFSFDDISLPTELKPIKSFITEFTTQTDIDCEINTISPIETAADKFSALLWRVNIKDRTLEINSPQNDPTIIRHLHDLSALKHLILTIIPSPKNHKKIV